MKTLPLLSLLVLAFSVRAATIKVACVGDSITFGAGASAAQFNYPSVLAGLLGVNYQVGNYGRSGATMLGPGFGDLPYATTAEYNTSSVFQPNIVVIMLGTNDSKPQNWANKTQFAADATAMITHYATLASKPQVYLCLPCPVYNAGNFGITNPIVHDEIIPILRSVAANTSTPLIDINTALSGQPGFFPDNVHPNDAGYAVLAQTVFSALSIATPGTLSATVISATRVDLAWIDNASNETAYVIERKVVGGTFAEIGAAKENYTEFSDTNVSPLTAYVYRIRAANPAGQSPFSNEAAAITPDYVPAAPTIRYAIAASSTQVDLAWDDNSLNEAVFYVERRGDGVTGWSRFGVPANQNGFSDFHVQPGIQYSYRIIASNSAGDSEPSETLLVTTFSPAEFTPTPGDSDGDGFSDDIETAAGSSTSDPHDTPANGAPAGTPLPLADLRMKIKLNFVTSGQDSINLSGTLLLPAGTDATGKHFVIDIAGVTASFTLDKRGAAKTSAGNASLKAKGSGVHSGKFSVKLRKGTFAPALAGAGLTNSNTSTAFLVPVDAVFGGTLYHVDTWQWYKAAAGKSGLSVELKLH